jgi:hypothetical protein
LSNLQSSTVVKKRRILGLAVVVLLGGILVAVFLPAPYHFYLPKEGVCCLDGPPRSGRIPQRIAISGGAFLVALALTIYAFRLGARARAHAADQVTL